MTVDVQIARSVPRVAEVVGVPVATVGVVPRTLGMSRATLASHGFEAKLGQTLVLPATDGPTHIAVGVGDPRALDATGLRTAAAALVRASGKRSVVATTLTDAASLDAGHAAQAVTEGALLASYRYAGIKREPNTSSLRQLVLVVSEARSRGAAAGVARAQVTAGATALARDLANTPPTYLTAARMADAAVELASASGLTVEVFDEERLAELGCGGMLGVNRGSKEPPRMVRLTYTPRNPVGHLALVGKGIMFDSGGLSLKTSEGMLTMKMDMSGAAAVLAAMSSLKALRCKSKVTGYLMCTDNMSGGDAFKLGDVLTFRNGKTSEIHNTDAEGRLVLADGLSLATEDRPDAIVDIATLTGACVVALGTRIAGVMGTDQPLIERLKAAGAKSDERVWQLPLESGYRKLLDSNVADMKNVGGPHAGAIVAGLFLREFVGDVPWAHVDIAGPMNAEADDGWLSRGATGFGARLLIELATGFAK